MPFNQEFDDIYKFGIQAAAEEQSIIAQRVDEQKFSETMLERIYKQIEVADFIIAEMTGKNPNVYYEVGYAHAKNKLCTLVTQNAEDIPFDLKHHRHLVYGGSIETLKTMLNQEFLWLKGESIRLKTIPLQIELLNTFGMLEKNDYSAYAEVTCTFDIRNRTEKRSPQIEAIYFYTGSSWEFQQDGQECASTPSDNAEYPKLRHFIKSNVTHLSSGGWTQIKIIGRRLVWNKFTGDPYQEVYKLKGRTIMEIITSEGKFIQQISMDVTADDIPF